jgi:hypothetical protein
LAELPLLLNKLNRYASYGINEVVPDGYQLKVG